MDFEEIRNQLDIILSCLHPELREVKKDEIMYFVEYAYGKGKTDAKTK